MAEKKQVGLYWGPNSFTIVEQQRAVISRRSHLSLGAAPKNEPAQDLPEDLRLTALLQQVVRDTGLAGSRIFLAVAARNLIFRSFVIPFMPPEEVSRVLEFEAPKYIPLKLEHLLYTYHQVPITEDKQKKLRIIFVAIRKDILNRDIEILTNAGLQTVYIEPSAVSLVRALTQNGVLPREGTQAVVTMVGAGEEVILVEDGVVQFVRELKAADAADAGAASAKLFNDVRVSFNYYARQNPSRQISKIILLAAQDPSHLAHEMSKEFNIATTPLTAAGLLKDDQGMELEYLHAYGAALKDKTASSKDFTFLNKSTGGQGEGFLALAKLDWRLLAGAAAVSLLMVLGAFFGARAMVAGAQARYAQLQEQQGPYGSFEVDQLETKTKELKDKMAAYNDIRYKSNVAFFLASVPAMLSEGAWLKNLDVTSYTDMVKAEDGSQKPQVKVSVVFEGFIYAEDANEQFRLVNQLLTSLRADKDWKFFFSNIDLASTHQDKMDDFFVTSFKIVAK